MRKFCPPVSASPKPRSHPLHRLETTQGMETTARQSLGSRCRRPVPPPLKRTSPPGIKCYSCCLEDWLYERATISWLHYTRFAAESFGIAAAQRSPNSQMLGWQTQNKQTVSSKSITQPHSKPLDPLARLKRGPLDVDCRRTNVDISSNCIGSKQCLLAVVSHHTAPPPRYLHCCKDA